MGGAQWLSSDPPIVNTTDVAGGSASALSNPSGAPGGGTAAAGAAVAAGVAGLAPEAWTTASTAPAHGSPLLLLRESPDSPRQPPSHSSVDLSCQPAACGKPPGGDSGAFSLRAGNASRPQASTGGSGGLPGARSSGLQPPRSSPREPEAFSRLMLCSLPDLPRPSLDLLRASPPPPRLSSGSLPDASSSSPHAAVPRLPSRLGGRAVAGPGPPTRHAGGGGGEEAAHALALAGVGAAATAAATELPAPCSIEGGGGADGGVAGAGVGRPLQSLDPEARKSGSGAAMPPPGSLPDPLRLRPGAEGEPLPRPLPTLEVQAPDDGDGDACGAAAGSPQRLALPSAALEMVRLGRRCACLHMRRRRQQRACGGWEPQGGACALSRDMAQGAARGRAGAPLDSRHFRG